MLGHPKKALFLGSRQDDVWEQVSLLAALGIKVVMARSVACAVRLLRRELFDAAILAAELDSSEDSFVARLSSLPSMRRIVVMGPAGDDVLEQRCRMHGAHGYLARPVSPNTLVTALCSPAAYCRKHDGA
jgi:response regulator RpfG family c-di-GMP phosphodiesterase